MKGKKSLCREFCNYECQNFVAIVFLQKLCDFEMDLIKRQLSFVECNFGLKSYYWFQIELALRARSILKSRVWFQTKLHSTPFNYHYKLLCYCSSSLGRTRGILTCNGWRSFVSTTILFLQPIRQWLGVKWYFSFISVSRQSFVKILIHSWKKRK